MDVEGLRAKYQALGPELTERSRRLWAATEALSLGHGGIGTVSRATGISRSTISRGLREVRAGERVEPGRIRRPGGGRKPTVQKDPKLARDLDALVEPTTAGRPQSPVRWTSRSTRRLARELQAMGHNVSSRLVADLLHAAGYSLQLNQKTREGPSHPDRDGQFRYLNASVLRHQRRHQPVISVDTKKKELVGDFKNGGREWRPKDHPEPVRVHDFLIQEKGKAIPYGVYDLKRNEGWVSVGIDHDTSTFAVRAIQRWWEVMGRPAYPRATSLLITADCGGSNGARVRLWKWELQQFADRTGLTLTVCHFPPGTSKWNRIEHRLFSHIAMNWRGKPLVSLAVIVSLIGATTSETGLRVRSELDKGRYPDGVRVTDEQMATLRLVPHRFHADWNYTIRPRSKRTK
ncbi:MAG: ISAzo13 family transposase [Euryarchaeota archaeon]|nr:ISAzo13 family transposase [Euryarchaeota archaeon]MDE1882283.1 ISAzo13 family transposase [Euryarchaeota archaeon]MDE2046655.1 ISAzo13 family transposase [Thermoplasmata archaeon]